METLVDLRASEHTLTIKAQSWLMLCSGKVAPQWALGSRGQQKSGCSRPAFQQLSWQRRTHRQATATLEPAVAQREPIAAQDQWIQKLLNLIPHDAIDRS